MKDIIFNNWISIVIIVVFGGYIVYLLKEKKMEQLRAIAYKLMLEAERTILGTEQGQNRFNQVFTRVYSMLPAWVKIFVSEDTLKKKIQEWYNQIADYLEDGSVNGTANIDLKMFK